MTPAATWPDEPGPSAEPRWVPNGCPQVRFTASCGGATVAGGSECFASSDAASRFARVAISLWTAISIRDASASRQRETVVIFAASWLISARIHRLFQRFAPSNIVIRRVHTRDAIRWAPLTGLAGVTVYGLLLVATVAVVHRGGPGWVNLIVVVAFWDAAKFAWLIPVSLVRLLRVRHQEKVLLRASQRTSATDPTPIHEVGVKAPAAAGHGALGAAVQ